MSAALEKIIRPIVEGQIRGFLKEHHSLVDAVDWYQPRKDKATTFTNSLSKRIVRDLLCVQSLVRMKTALLECSAGTSLNSAVEVCSCGERAPLGNITERGNAP